MPTYVDFDWVPAAELKRLSEGELPWRYYFETAVHFDAAELRGFVRPLPTETAPAATNRY